MGFPSSSRAFAGSRCEMPDITRNYLGRSGWKMRYRTGMNRSGYGIHPSISSLTMHREIHQQAGKLVRSLHALGQDYSPNGKRWSFAWTGVAGAKVCKPGYHRYGAAIDFTKFSWGGQRYVDLAVHGTSGKRYLRRRYLAVVATCRRYFGTVLHCYHDPDGTHWNHIHADRGRHVVAFDWNYQTDVTIIQWAARDLAGVGLKIDGRYGRRTREGFEVLRERFGAHEVDPTASSINARKWLLLIARHAMANADAGRYTMN